jgi:hypothetical protein
MSRLQEPPNVFMFSKKNPAVAVNTLLRVDSQKSTMQTLVDSKE